MTKTTHAITGGAGHDFRARIDLYRQQHAGRSLCDLGVLLQRVKDELAELPEAEGQPSEYRAFMDRRRKDLEAERAALTILIDGERHRGEPTTELNRTLSEIKETLWTLAISGEAERCSDVTALTILIDQQRYRGERTTWAWLNKNRQALGVDKLPDDVTEFINLVLSSSM